MRPEKYGWVGGKGGGGGWRPRLSETVLQMFRKTWIFFSNFGTSKLIIFCKETTLLLSVRR